MIERRRDKRIPVKVTLDVSDLFKQDNEHIYNIDSPIEVFDISKSGIGFTTKGELPLGYYFNANIQLGNEDSNLYTVVKIVRRVEIEDGIKYGSEFVGLAPVLHYIFDEYEKSLEKDNE